MLTKIDLCSMALLKIGEKPIQSFNEDTAAAQLSRTLFDTVTDALVVQHPWRFAIRTVDLVKTTDHHFVIPADVKRVLSCSCPGYSITSGRINAAGDKVSIKALVRVGVEEYPAYFIPVAATKLAMEFCIPLTENQNTFKILAALFESELRTAKFIDSTTTTNSDMSDFSLLSARF